MIISKAFHFILKASRKIYSSIFPPKPPSVDLPSADEASDAIYQLLTTDKPCMVARFGSTELNATVNYIGVRDHHVKIWDFITRQAPQWWWNENSILQMRDFSGFFPPTREAICRFSEMMLADMQQVDILGSWRPEERFVANQIKSATTVPLLCLEPYWAKNPWSRALEGKNVLVVHPFADSIRQQYENRTLLFEDQRVLPTFKELHVIKAVQSLGGESNGFKDWFEALEWMKSEMDKTDYDIALIGCGAYGFPLAAHAKRMGKKAILLAGALQLLFGIKGKRWENPMYGAEDFGSAGLYPRLMNNDHWIYPSTAETPQVSNTVEGACYWK